MRASWAIHTALPRVRWLKRLALLSVMLGFLLPLAGVLSVPAAVYLVLVPLVIYPVGWLVPIYQVWLARRGSTVWSGELSYTFDPNAVVARGAGTDSRISWSAVTSVAETRRFFLLFTSNQCAVILPKRAISSTSIAEFRSLFEARAGAPETSGERFAEWRAPEASAPAIEARFQWDIREGYRAIRSMARYGPALWPWYLMMVLTIVAVSGPSLYRQWHEGGWAAINLVQLLGTMAAIGFIAGLVPLASLWSSWSFRRTNRMAAGEQIVGFGADGITTSGPLHHGHFAWDAVTKAVETSEFFLFFVTKIQALFIPVRVLEPAARERLRALVKAQLKGKATLRS